MEFKQIDERFTIFLNGEIVKPIDLQRIIGYINDKVYLNMYLLSEGVYNFIYKFLI